MGIMSGQVSYAKAKKELTKNSWKSAGLKFMKGMKLASGSTNNLITKMCKRMSDSEAKGDSEREDVDEDGSDDDDSEAFGDLEEELDQAREIIQERDNEIA